MAIPTALSYTGVLCPIVPLSGCRDVGEVSRSVDVPSSGILHFLLLGFYTIAFSPPSCVVAKDELCDASYVSASQRATDMSVVLRLGRTGQPSQYLLNDVALALLGCS